MSISKKSSFAALLVSVLLLLGNPAQATTVYYDVTGGGTGYAYSIVNDSLGFDIFEVSIYFDYEIFEVDSLNSPAAPPGWDPFVFGPPDFVNDDGFYDVLALGSGLAPGETLNGLSVQYGLLPGKTAGAQFFEVLDPLTFDVLDSGFTVPSPIPVPAAIWLFFSGVIGLLALGRRRG